MTTVPLPDDTTAAAAARIAAERWAVGNGWRENQCGDLLLVVSELASNAAQHGSPPITLTLVAQTEGVLVTVTDCGHTSTPVARQAGHADARGRGLSIVARLSVRTGWRQREDGVEVWAVVPRPSP